MAKEKVFWPETDDTTVVPVEIVDEVKASMLQYGMSVLVGRALPDVRDGLKPVHRRILYTMYENGLTPEKAYRKCADTVGAVLGRYHPHGDSSVYEAMVRMAQDFSLRYPLIDGHGNFGNIDGYPAAAYRYTESKMNRLSTHMLDDIDKDTVDFVPNYDDRLKEPVVLPVRFPQLLVNGSSGIAFGMATEIPPHNLGEVIDGMCCLIDNPDADLSEICEHIKGPDFPTGGIIMGRSGIRAAYATGKGRIIVRGKTEIEELSNGKFRITITEIPYKVRKEALVKKIYDLASEKRIEGIDDVVDYSSKRDGGIRIVVDVKKDANPQVVLNKLFSYTELQTTFGANLIAIVNGKPQILTLKEMLQNSIDFQCEIIRRRTEYDRKKAQERAHILEALKVALDFIDEVINIIRNSKTIPESKEALSERFGFDDIQTTAIVQMQLGKLAGLEKQKILDELKEKLDFIKECEDILANHSRVLDIVKTESLNLRDKYTDDRRTEITDVAGEVDIEDLIPEEECILTKTVAGYIKRIPTDSYTVQRRGGTGRIGIKTREGDDIDSLFTCSSHDYIMMFSNLGRLYRLKAYEIPEASLTSKGTNLINILPLMPNEKIINVLPVGKDLKIDTNICMLTRNGTIKRTALDAFKNVRKTGIIAINIREDDELAYVVMTNGDEDILVATAEGKAIRFNENDAREMGRTASGVRAIKLREGDKVVGMTLCREDADILTVTENGMGKRCGAEEYRTQTRGGQGTTNYVCTEKSGLVVAVVAVTDDNDILAIAANGKTIRMPASDIRRTGRRTKGVTVMRNAAQVLSVAVMTHEETDETITDAEGEAAESGAENTPDTPAEE